MVPGLGDLVEARPRLAGRTVVTPLLTSERLDARLGARVLAKAEMLQPTGSYKLRGALNLLDSLAPGRKRFVTFSSGNYARALAAAAHAAAAEITIVMPTDAPAVKIESTRAEGAEVVLHDPAVEAREQATRRIADARRLPMSHPHEEPALIAGYGTAGLELGEQATALGCRPDVVVVPCSGGCLLAGIGLALRASDPDVELIGVEPLGFEDTARSLEAGRPVSPALRGLSICDALLARRPGTLPFGMLRDQRVQMLAVSDERCLQAMALAFEHLGVVAEPSGAIALAAILAHPHRFAGRTIAVVLSGGNVDPALFRLALAAAPAVTTAPP